MSSKQNVIHHLDGLDAAQNKDWLKAIAIFRKIQSPSAAILFNIGCCCFNLKQFAEAEEALQLCISKDNYLAVAFYQLAVVQGFLDKLSDSVENFYACCKAMRNNAFIDYKQLNMNCIIHKCDALYNIGLVYIFCDDLNLGESYLKEALDSAKTSDKQRLMNEALRAIQKNNLQYFNTSNKTLADSIILLAQQSLFAPSKAMREGVVAGTTIKQQSAKVLLADNEEYAFVGFVGPRKIPKNSSEQYKSVPNNISSQHSNAVPPPPAKTAFKIPPMPIKPPPMPGKPPPMPGKHLISPNKKGPPPRPAIKPKMFTNKIFQSANTSYIFDKRPYGTNEPQGQKSYSLSKIKDYKKTKDFFPCVNDMITCNFSITMELKGSEISDYSKLISKLKDQFMFISKDLTVQASPIELLTAENQIISSRTWQKKYCDAIKNKSCAIKINITPENITAKEEYEDNIYCDNVAPVSSSISQEFEMSNSVVVDDGDEIYSDHLMTDTASTHYTEDDVYATNVSPQSLSH